MNTNEFVLVDCFNVTIKLFCTFKMPKFEMQERAVLLAKSVAPYWYKHL